jgi:glycosyltransferase involved in cell wall biosynthesis
MNPTKSKIDINNQRINTICAPTHERTEGHFQHLNCDFWAWMKTGVFKPGWNIKFNPIPSNYHLLDERLGENQLPDWVTPHICLSQNKFGQFGVLSQLSQRYQIPLINYEHTEKMPWWSKDQLRQLNEMRGNINVFIAKSQMENWEWEDRNDTILIRHCVDTDLFSPDNVERQNHVLTVGNDYIGRNVVLDFQRYKRVVLDRGIKYRAVGDTKGFSEAPPNVKALVKEYQSSRIFFNSHNISPIPTSLLESMSVGCAVLSCKTCEIPYYIQHGENGFLYSSDEEAIKYLDLLLHDKNLCEKLGRAARQTIIEKCNVNRFTEQWNEAFNRARNLL